MKRDRLSLMRLMLLGCFSISTAMFALPANAAKPKIGETTLVVEQVNGTSEDIRRRLNLEDDVHQDELIETGLRSASEMLFADGSRITVGPFSEVFLDKFVYDPDPGEGALALRVTEGVFRFVSGNMDSTNYSIDAPSVTIGVRGTIIAGVVHPLTHAVVMILESKNSQAFFLADDGETMVVDTPGRALILLPDGSMSEGDPPGWATSMVDAMDTVIAQANITVPPAEPQPAAAPPPVPPAVEPPPPPPPPPPPDEEPAEDEKLRGLPRATANHIEDDLPSGLDKAANGQANHHAREPDGGPGGGNNGDNGRDGSGNDKGGHGADAADDDGDGGNGHGRDNAGGNGHGNAGDNGRGEGRGRD